jgi:radical SAM protein with 4Fe4S-binding SPASM domain
MKAKLESPVYRGERVELYKRIPLVTPLVVYTELSGYCNLKCEFCPQKTDSKFLKKDIMSVNLFKKLIDDLAVFPEKIKLLRLCGTGEPLVNKDIVKMMQYAKERGVVERIELITNGTLLNADLIKNLPRFADRIMVSVEGLSSEDYKNICSANINFQNLLDNLGTLYANKKKCVIYIKIHNQAIPSERKKTKFLNMFSDRCDEIFIEKLVPIWPQANSAYSTKEIRWGGGKITKCQICVQFFKGVQVQADGEVVPCCVDWKRVNVLGDINKNSFAEIWNGEKMKKLRMEHLKGNKGITEPCKDCTMNDCCDPDNIDQHAKECMLRLQNN